MLTAAVFHTNYLRYSQTFVFDEIRHHARYAVEVFAWRRMNMEHFPFEPVHSAGLWYAATSRCARFESRFAERKYDLVHGHFGTSAVYAMPYALKFNLPLVVTFHGYDVPLLVNNHRFMPAYWIYALRGKRLLREMTMGLCCSTDLRDLLIEIGAPKEKLVIHRLGVDLGAFPVRQPAASGPLQIAMIGRFVEKKGFEYGLHAFGKIVRNGIDARLTIIGGGRRESILRRVTAALGVVDRVTFSGVVPSKEVARRLAETDVLLAPSVVTADGNRESGLIVAKEASASGVVPIGTLHGGIPEIIDDEKTGYLVPERDADAIADRLGRLARDRALLARMSAAAREKMVREYDIAASARALEDRYDEARERHRASGRHRGRA